MDYQQPNDSGAARPNNLLGRTIYLSAPSHADVEALYRIEVEGDGPSSWRFRSGHPSPEQYYRSLWEGTAATFAVRSRRTDAVVGLVSVYKLNLTDGTAFAAVIVEPEARQSAAGLEAMAILISHSFDSWPLRKLYFEVLEPNLGQFGSAVTRGLLIEEARLRAHARLDGAYVDQIIFAMYRHGWSEARTRVERFFRGPAASGSSDPQYLRWDEFATRLARELGVSVEGLTPETPLGQVERSPADRWILAGIIEELLGREVQGDYVREMRTLADAFDLIREAD